jgi:hypothetical protein
MKLGENSWDKTHLYDVVAQPFIYNDSYSSEKMFEASAVLSNSFGPHLLKRVMSKKNTDWFINLDFPHGQSTLWAYQIYDLEFILSLGLI